MNTIELIQGSPEWHAHRAQHFNASDAPAMMGCSPYLSRNELLARIKTGISPEVDAATQRRFDDGHRFEALARPLAEDIIGEELYAVTGTKGNLSASFDGLTMLECTAFEHKTLNESLRYTPWDEGNGDHLPMHYRVQMEQQLIVSGAKCVLFMATKWDGDTLAEERHCWYSGDPALRAKIVAGWDQFERDLAEFVPQAKAAPVVAAPVETLPAVSVRVDGALAIVSNLPSFGEALRTFIAKIPEQPNTDQEFADTEAACKSLKKAEEALDAAEDNALASLADVNTMRRLVADYKALARATRLQREKLVAARKESIKGDIVHAGRLALVKHITELNAAMPADFMPQVPADFGACIKGLRTLDSIRNAVDSELARAKIAAGEIATRIHANIKTLAASGLVVHDAAALVTKSPDDLAATISQRLAAEKAREEAQRERIRAEEVEKLERERIAAEQTERKVREAAEEMARQREQQEADEVARATAQAAQAMQRAAAPAMLPPPPAPPAPVESPPVAAADTGARLTLGQINQILAPVSISVAGLSELGFEPVAQVKASRLYRESDLPAIARAIARHVVAAAAGVAA